MKTKMNFVRFLSLTLLSLGLSGCYGFNAETKLDLIGRVLDPRGVPQLIDLNSEIQLCFTASISDQSLDGRREISDCRPLTTSSQGEYRIPFSDSTRLYNMLWMKNKPVTVKSFSVYLEIDKKRQMEGQVTSIREVRPNHFEVTTDFTINVSNYRPDYEIDINHSKKKY